MKSCDLSPQSPKTAPGVIPDTTNIPSTFQRFQKIFTNAIETIGSWISSPTRELTILDKTCHDIKQKPLNPEELNPEEQDFIKRANKMKDIIDAYRAQESVPKNVIDQFDQLLDRQLVNKFVDRKKVNLIFPWPVRYITIFHLLAKRGGPVEFVQVLANKGADFDLASLDSQGKIWGNTPLVLAIANANNSIAMEILEVGNKMQHKPNLDLLCNGKSAIHLAIAKKYKDIPFDDQYQPLKYSNFQLVKKLVECGANVNIQDSNGNTPLHLAYLRRNQEMIKFLEDNGADKNCENHNGEFPSDMSDKSYDEAFDLLKVQTCGKFILDKNKFVGIHAWLGRNLLRFHS